MKGDNSNVCRRMEIKIDARIRRGSPRKRWMYCIQEDLREKGLSEEKVNDRKEWKLLVRNRDPI